MENGLVDIIIPVYNSEKYLRKCLDSIFLQKYQRIRVNIVYTPSIDNTLKIIKEYIKKYGDIINLIKSEKVINQAQARNMALQNIKGEYIAFLDSDDYWHPDKLINQINVLQKNNIGGTYTDVVIINDRGIEIKKIKTPEWDKALWLKKRYITFSSVLLKTKYVKKQKLFFDNKLKIGEDFDFLINFSKYYPLKKTSGFYTFYRVHSKNISRDINEALKYRMIIYKKHKMYSLYFYTFLAYIKYNMNRIQKRKYSEEL